MLYDGPGRLAFNGLVDGFESYLALRKLDASQRALVTSLGVLKGAPEAAGRITANAMSGYSAVAEGRELRTVSGEIGAVRHVTVGGGAGPFWWEDSSYSDIDVTNSDDEAAIFEVVAQYGYNARLLGLPWIYMPTVVSELVEVAPGETKTVRLPYKQGEQRGSPDAGSTISIDILASNASGTFFVGNRFTEWMPQRVNKAGAIVRIAGTEEPITLPNPIDVFVLAGGAPQEYEAQVWLTNPLSESIQAMVVQELPAGATVTATDGMIDGSSVRWTRTVLASDIVSMTLTFRHSAAPGTVVSLPPARLTFIEPASGEAVALTSNVARFSGMAPATVQASVPLGLAGQSATMPVTVTNLLDEPLTGAVTIEILDEGDLVHRASVSFRAPALGDDIPDFVLPDTIPAGTYDIALAIEVFGGRQQVLRRVYTVRGWQILLPQATR